MIINPYVFARATELADAIMALSPWGYWPMSDGPSATQALDQSGNAHHVTGGTYTADSVASPLISEGVYAAEVGVLEEITGADTNYLANIAASFGYADAPFSIFAIVKFNSLGVTQGIFHIGDFAISGDQGIALYAAADSKVYIQFLVGSFLYTASVALSTGVTYSIGAIRTAAGDLTVYVDGVASGSTSSGNTGSISIAASMARIHIGCASFGGDEALLGTIQHVALFDSDIGSTGMADLHTATGL